MVAAPWHWTVKTAGRKSPTLAYQGNERDRVHPPPHNFGLREKLTESGTNVPYQYDTMNRVCITQPSTIYIFRVGGMSRKAFKYDH